jgi:hypothetical protein
MFEELGLVDGQAGRVTIMDVEPDVFGQLLEFLYTGKVAELRFWGILLKIIF